MFLSLDVPELIELPDIDRDTPIIGKQVIHTDAGVPATSLRFDIQACSLRSGIGSSSVTGRNH